MNLKINGMNTNESIIFNNKVLYIIKRNFLIENK